MKPLPPDVLANALQDRVHATSGRLISSGPVKGGKHQSPTEDRKIDVTELAVLYRPKPQPEVKETPHGHEDHRRREEDAGDAADE